MVTWSCLICIIIGLCFDGWLLSPVVEVGMHVFLEQISLIWGWMIHWYFTQVAAHHDGQNWQRGTIESTMVTAPQRHSWPIPSITPYILGMFHTLQHWNLLYANGFMSYVPPSVFEDFDYFSSCSFVSELASWRWPKQLHPESRSSCDLRWPKQPATKGHQWAPL